jgi:hypothetical protein
LVKAGVGDRFRKDFPAVDFRRAETSDSGVFGDIIRDDAADSRSRVGADDRPQMRIGGEKSAALFQRLDMRTHGFYFVQTAVRRADERMPDIERQFVDDLQIGLFVKTHGRRDLADDRVSERHDGVIDVSQKQSLKGFEK